jgi:hypothetical protein
MSDGHIYVFVRQDLAIADQIVHSNHAIYHLASMGGVDCGVPSVIVVGMPHEKSMSKVLDKLRVNQLPHYAWKDPDFNDLGVTSIATGPLTNDQRKVLANYRLYDPRANGERTPVLQAIAALSGERGATPS